MDLACRCRQRIAREMTAHETLRLARRDAQRIGTYGVAPFAGNFQLLLTTFTASEGGGLSGTNDIPVNGAGGLTSQLGLPAGTITFTGAVPVGGGSAYQMSLGSLNVGDQIGVKQKYR
jgi:hypothetical protein